MTRILIVAASLLALAVPTALAAAPADSGKPASPGNSASAPGQSAEKNAAKQCKAERGTTAQSIDAFRQKYGTNHNLRNAFGKCVSSKSKNNKDEKADDKGKSSSAAAKACKAERGTTSQSIEAFKNKYGTNANKANAFGKCVSAKSKSGKDEQDD
jgi:ABC-type microcin C transport system permease subunit YejB